MITTLGLVKVCHVFMNKYLENESYFRPEIHFKLSSA